MNPIDCGWKSLFCAVLCFVTFSPSAPAATALANLSYSPDITIAIPITVNDETVVTDDRAGNVVVDDLSIDALPANLAVDGFHRQDSDNVLFSLETTAVLGSIVVRPGDVVRYNQVSNSYDLAFDASAVGLPDGVNVEAVSMRGSRLILAFDTAVLLDGIVFQDEDLAGYDGTVFTMMFDGSAAGVAPGLAVDGAEVLANGQLLLSFDGSGQVGGNVLFADEDVLEYTTGNIWELVFDGSVAAAAWVAADLQALAATAGGGLIFSDQFEN